ncbi:MAG: hypothetical protein ACREQI_01595, partial [Candidatus Binataceae bacterium]
RTAFAGGAAARGGGHTIQITQHFNIAPGADADAWRREANAHAGELADIIAGELENRDRRKF